MKNKNIDSFIVDASVLLMSVTRLSKVELVTKDTTIIDEQDFKIYLSLLERRGNNEPVQYIINHAEFMGLDFYVDDNVLIPRPDTEILVEELLKVFEIKKYASALEIGTGSGCISISLAKYCKEVAITAADISPNALGVAKKNSIKNEVYSQITFLESDLFKNIPHKKFDVIISNPPYIRTEVISTLEPNVKNFEPILALDGGFDGLYFYKNIINNTSRFLNSKGCVAFEIGFDQGLEVKEILKQNNFSNIKIIKDYAGNDRVVTGMIGEM